MKRTLYVGKNPLQFNSVPIEGHQVDLEGESFYQIANYDRMRPFFMSIVSGADHWMFISSTGAVTAGRRNADLALFPYYTDDKIHDSAEITGSKTMFIVEKQGRSHLWEPFSERYRSIYRLQRNLYKSFWGNKLLFEESNADLGLTFRYGWFNSDRFGWIRRAWLTNSGLATVRVKLLDGIQNLMPCGIGSQFQLEYSTLLDAYKKSELIPETGLGLFRLSAIPIDRPEPAEALRTTTVWSFGLGKSLKLLSSTQLNSFRQEVPLRQETEVRAERGAYFLHTALALSRGQTRDWYLVADVNQGPSDVAELNRLLRQPTKLRKLVDADIARGTEELRRIVGKADGLQKTAQPIGNARHYSNVLFNVMRGGIFYDSYQVNPDDLQAFVRHANKEVAARHTVFFRKLGKRIHHPRLLALAVESGDPNLERLCREYLPLTFSRRHGDPSRPWNRFSIATKNPDGTRILNYEGNWRDIFQNWEALSLSFPGYTASMICKFTNASTADGYNPYRITRDGIDWEVIDPADPWTHIGYWGDHQVIYLLKLLEILERHEEATLHEFLTRKIFSYANVPYRIKPYDQLLANPKQTVDFDPAQNELTGRRVQSKGSDGKLIWDAAGQIHLVNLTEKMLVLLLAKISNFVPEAGIWLNTQRPEWNDANNALVGNGTSMVTLYYLRRYLAFSLAIFRSLEKSEVSLSAEVARFFFVLHRILKCHEPLLTKPICDRDRRHILADLGRASSRYRKQIYTGGFSGRIIPVKGKQLLDFFNVALAFTEESIQANRRPDGLYHAYNLIKLDRHGEIPIRRLYTMLEGQVAALSSGCLSAEKSLGLLMALKRSELYRADQHSYLLYPNRRLPQFIEKNNIPNKEIARSRLLKKLLENGNRLLVEQDVAGRCHFNAAITNAQDLRWIFEKLALSGYARLVNGEKELVLEIFERLFDHQSFTGRSGTFFGYEGLGCIYWHMVSKLLLAAQETFFRALDSGAPPPLLRKLAGCYHDIRSGIGDHKSPGEYGAFPMDPYSHTPAHAGARQPGLTGQVKEDILCRMGELGVFVKKGEIYFCPALLRREEFLSEPANFHYYDLTGSARRLRLQPGSLAYTYCQVPVIYRLGRQNGLCIFFNGKPTILCKELRLDAVTSQFIFNRTGRVSRIVVTLSERKDFCHEEYSGLNPSSGFIMGKTAR
jgi:hypothetical protein